MVHQQMDGLIFMELGIFTIPTRKTNWLVNSGADWRFLDSDGKMADGLKITAARTTISVIMVPYRSWLCNLGWENCISQRLMAPWKALCYCTLMYRYAQNYYSATNCIRIDHYWLNRFAVYRGSHSGCLVRMAVH